MTTPTQTTDNFTPTQDVFDFLADWDAGKDVTSVEMGGLSPSYEQAIQIMAFEILRVLIEMKVDFADPKYDYKDDLKSPEYNNLKKVWEKVDVKAETAWEKAGLLGKYGPSGAQVSAARNLATVVYRHGYGVALGDDAVKDRKVTVNKKNSIDF